MNTEQRGVSRYVNTCWETVFPELNEFLHHENQPNNSLLLSMWSVSHQLLNIYTSI